MNPSWAGARLQVVSVHCLGNNLIAIAEKHYAVQLALRVPQSAELR